jgi:hypothetical protein
VAPTAFQGESYGFDCSGMTGAYGTEIVTIEKISFASDGHAVDSLQDLTMARKGSGGSTDFNANYGYIQGGRQNTVPKIQDRIDRFAMVSGGDATDVGNLTVARLEVGASSSSTHGYAHGGDTGPQYNDTIDKFAYASTSNSTDVGNMTWRTAELGGGTSESYGYLMGGYAYSTSPSYSGQRNVIEKYSFAADGDATDVGNLVAAQAGSRGGCSSSTHIYLGGGHVASSNSAAIDKWAIASDGDATDVGDLTVARQYQSGISSTTYGYITGGQSTYPSYYDTIDKFSVASDGDATDVGNTLAAKRGSGTCQY